MQSKVGIITLLAFKIILKVALMKFFHGMNHTVSTFIFFPEFFILRFLLCLLCYTGFMPLVLAFKGAYC